MDTKLNNTVRNESDAWIHDMEIGGDGAWTLVSLGKDAWSEKLIDQLDRMRVRLADCGFMPCEGDWRFVLDEDELEVRWASLDPICPMAELEGRVRDKDLKEHVVAVELAELSVMRTSLPYRRRGIDPDVYMTVSGYMCRARFSLRVIA